MQAEPDGADFIDGDVNCIFSKLYLYKYCSTSKPQSHHNHGFKSFGAQAELVVLGGAFFINGNVNPAAEANIFGDPDAADIVLSGSANTRVVNPLFVHYCDCESCSSTTRSCVEIPTTVFIF